LLDHVEKVANPTSNIPEDFGANPDNDDDDYAMAQTLDVWGVVSTQFWTTLGGYFLPPEVWMGSNLLDFLFLFGEAGGYAILGGLVTGRGEGLKGCSSCEELAVELRGWKSRGGMGGVASMESLFYSLSAWIAVIEGNREGEVGIFDCCFATNDYVKVAEGNVRLQIVERSVIRMSMSESLAANSSKGKGGIMDRFSFLGGISSTLTDSTPESSSNVSTDELIDEQIHHTEHFLLPSNDNALSRILESVSADNKTLNEDFKVLIAKINVKSREVETERRNFQLVLSRRDEQKEHVRILKDRKGCLMEMVVGLMDKAVKEGDNGPNDEAIGVLMEDITHLQRKTSEVETELA